MPIPKLAVTESAATFKAQTLFSIPMYLLNHTVTEARQFSPLIQKEEANDVHLDSTNPHKPAVSCSSGTTEPTPM